MPSPYNYVFDPLTNTYNFVTNHQILYRVAFVVDETFSAISGTEIPNIFQLVIEKITDGIEPYDANVSKTVETIIDQFFQRAENALIYICSEAGDKARQRHTIFDRWYRKSKAKDVVMKIDNIIEVNADDAGAYRLYTSFLFHKDNPNYSELIAIYNQIEAVLNADK